MSALDEIFQKVLSGQINLYDVINAPGLKGEEIVNAIEQDPSLKVIPSADGKIGTVENKENIKDWGKNNSAFPLHLDGPYYTKIPRWVILYCVNPGGIGGETFLASAEKVIEKLGEKFDSNLLENTYIIYLSSDRKKY